MKKVLKQIKKINKKDLIAVIVLYGVIILGVIAINYRMEQINVQNNTVASVNQAS